MTDEEQERIADAIAAKAAEIESTPTIFRVISTQFVNWTVGKFVFKNNQLMIESEEELEKFMELLSKLPAQVGGGVVVTKLGAGQAPSHIQLADWLAEKNSLIKKQNIAAGIRPIGKEQDINGGGGAGLVNPNVLKPIGSVPSGVRGPASAGDVGVKAT